MKQQLLFTPGPLLTSKTVKEALQIDMGSRDPNFINVIQDIRKQLVKLALADDSYTAVLLQGSGSYGVEAVLQTTVNKQNHKVLVVANGSYGERMTKILDATGRQYSKLAYNDDEVVNADDVVNRINEDISITHLAIVHSETTSGIINPIDFAHRFNRRIIYILDAVSSFGAYSIDVTKLNIDFLVSTSNKNLQGIPGFAFVISRKEILDQCKGNADSLVLDLYDQEQNMNATKQFRFTPPTHALMGFHQALKEYNEQGGVVERFRRYNSLQQQLLKGMTELGFKTLIDQRYQGCIITTFHQPTDDKFNFQDFYDYLASRNLVIYPGKLTRAITFRIGSIGELYPEDMELLLKTIREYVIEKGIKP